MDEVVVTVPAYFGELQRRATRDACDLAGLRCERIINEPTAAALAYGLHEKDREELAVVLDLGGGTFDVTVLELVQGVVEIRSTAGDARLGGEDFTDALAQHLSMVVERTFGSAPLDEGTPWARFRAACDGVKRQLSTRDRAKLALVDAQLKDGTHHHLELDVTLDDMDLAHRGLVERMLQPIARALRDADLGPDAIGRVLLVGGATRMRCVAELVTKHFGKLPHQNLHPDETVALGAAVQAALKAGHAAVDDLVVTDVAPFSLGIATVCEFAGRKVTGVFTPIIERGTVLPASRVRPFSTIVDSQTRMEIEVYQGEHSMCTENQLLGKYTARGIPRGPAGQPVDVRFSYDLNGILEVDTTIGATQETHSLTIEQAPGRLSKAALEEAKERLRRLKFHPKEALPNVTALQRAETLHVELVGTERELLASAIAFFRATLEAQDPNSIEAARGRLNELASALKRH